MTFKAIFSCAVVAVLMIMERSFAQPPSSGTSCDACGSSASYSETLTTDETSGLVTRTITSTGCPNHYSVCTGKKGVSGCGEKGTEGTKTEATEQNKNIGIPAKPKFRSSESDQSCTMGAIGIALNGVSIYGPAVDTQCTALDLDDTFSEWIGFDMCSGHAQNSGDYHYHLPPSCLNHQAMASDKAPSNGHPAQIGWAFDGLPVYGPTYKDGTAVTGTDSCGGKEEALPEVDDFLYRYYFTGSTSDLYSLPTNPKPDSTTDQPYSFKCYKGCTLTELNSDDGSLCTKDAFSTTYTPNVTEGYTTPFASYGTSGTNFFGTTYTSAFLSNGFCSSSGETTAAATTAGALANGYIAPLDKIIALLFAVAVFEMQ